MSDTLQCYNRGCGQKYSPAENNDSSCRHHPGEPFFHDAYKGWSCCNKKCTDFTEFLNIKGCTLSRHSNVKPPEPEKPQRLDGAPDEVIEVKPIVRESMERPAFDTPMVTMKAEVAPSLRQQAKAVVEKKVEPTTESATTGDEVAIGTTCKNSGCGVTYEGPQTDQTPCVYHPGYPVFHEGLKFWTCCTKRTSDFNAFLNQLGCESGQHLWIKKESNAQSVHCRWDYHQTGTHVVVSIYAKNYCPDATEIKLNPVRLYVNIVFPQKDNAAFNLDVELRGIVDVDKSQANMYGTKVEIKLKKAEPGSWAMLDVPRERRVETKVEPESTLESKVESVDLSDL